MIVPYLFFISSHLSFKYGPRPAVGLSLSVDFELADHLAAYDQPWRTLPNADLELTQSADADVAKESACLEVSLNHSLLKDGGQVIVAPSFFPESYENPTRVQHELAKCAVNVVPVIIYAFIEETLAEKDLMELKIIRVLMPNSPVFFIKIPLPPAAGKNWVITIDHGSELVMRHSCLLFLFFRTPF